MMICAAFGMAGDDMGCPDIGQHCRRYIAGMRAMGGGVAILSADGDR
jgi:proline dehydrogenase